MKGIVVEINKKDAVVLTDDGLFTEVKNQNYAVGQAIRIQESRKTYSRLVAGAASMVAAFGLCTVGAYAWFTPTDYVSLDVNPSVEYSLNTFDRILEAKAVNDDGEKILDGLELKNKNIEDAVKETLDKLMANGYLTNDPNGGVVITTSNDEMGDAKQLAAELEKDIQTYLDDQEDVTAKVDAEAVAPERVEEARELGVTPGKLNLVEKLQNSTTGAISVEEWLTKPVKEINKAIKENRKAEKGDAESINGSDREDAVTTKGGIGQNGKPEKQDKERNDQTTMNNNGHEIEKPDRGSDQKTDEQKNDEQKPDALKDNQKADGAKPDNGKPPKDGSHQNNGDSSDKDKDKDKDKDQDN